MVPGSSIEFGKFNNISIMSGGYNRTATLYVPTIDTLQLKAPLIVDIHGWGCTMENQIAKSRFNKFADEEGFVVVWPSGYFKATQPLWPSWLPLPVYPSWGFVFNAGTCCPMAAAKLIDDVGFIADLIEYIKAEVRSQTESTREIDSNRIYASGISGGAMFVNRLACELNDVFAAVGPVSGPITNGQIPGILPAVLSGSDPFHCSGSMPTLYFHGTADEVVPYYFNFFDQLFLGFPSIPYYKSQRKKLNGIDPSDKGIVTYKHEHATCTSFGSPEVNTTFCDMDGGAHSWPGDPNGHKKGIFRTDFTSIDASRAMLAFFKQHSKKPSVCNSHLNMDTDGDVIVRFRGLNSHGECCTKCQESKECKVFTFAHRDGGMFSGISKGDCWLRSTVGQKVHKQGITYGMKPTPTLSAVIV
jgi:polyhydroxybutyrate depolymerase